MNEPAAVMLRTNVSRTTADALGAELRTAGVGVEPGTLATGAWRVRAIGDPAALPAVREGRATPQDEASQAVVDVLDPQPEQRVLDTCAAPGGKATGAAERMRDAGTVVAIDLHQGRLNLVRRAAARLRLRSVHCVLADARTLPAAGAGFDRVLVDAPCSGLGVLRRRPEARWRVRPEAVPVLAELQRQLLAAATPALRPGGVLVYAVCTLTREETLEVGTWAAAALDGLVAMDPPGPPWRSWGSGALLLPQDADTDGMYVARFRRP
jgi:16S rRNA (cytosine967-C5)-methyltransferase